MRSRINLLVCVFVCAWSHCVVFQNEELSKRIKDYGKCLSMVSSDSERVVDSLYSNVFDAVQPLSLVYFGPNATQLRLFSQRLAITMFGTHTKRPVRVIDVEKEVEKAEFHAGKLQEDLRVAIADQLSRCPDRSILIFDNMHVIRESLAPALDVFLDPLTGQRSLVRSETNQLLDAKNAIFVFLFRVESSEADAVMPEWQAYLEQQWAHSGDDFTPSAVIGRLSQAAFLDAEAENPDELLCAVFDESEVEPQPWTLELVIFVTAMCGLILFLLSMNRSTPPPPPAQVPRVAKPRGRTTRTTPSKQKKLRRSRRLSQRRSATTN